MGARGRDARDRGAVLLDRRSASVISTIEARDCVSAPGEDKLFLTAK
jgi:hypothetical protein